MLDFTLIINHQLFSDYYLGQILNRVTKKADRSREKAWQQLIALYERNRFENEDRLLARTGRFYDKIFEVMGFALDEPKTVELEEHAFEFSRTLYHEGKLISAIVYMPYGYSYDKKRREGKHFRPSYQNTLKEAIEELGLGWGIITNGETIRLIKAGSGKAYLEFRIADMCRYGTPDIYEQAFSVFFDLLAQEHLHSGYLDIVYEESKKHGTQVSDTLKDAILESIELFARGILHNPKNAPLLNMPDDIGTLFDESIIFMYRMLFVLYAEAHNLLPVADNRIYKENYSLDRLVDKIRLAGYTPDRNSSELWQSLKALFKILEKGINHRSCAIAALNGELNSSKEHPLLDQVELNDEIMADIIRRLTLTQVKGGGLDRISYRELDVAQLGSVYEGLLEYEPKIAEANLTIEKIKGNDQLIRAKTDDKVAIREGEFYLSLWGGSRKGSGSYYTPKELTTFLVEKTLEPLVKNRKSSEVLELKVIDTAMGSGAFLVAAINYLARVYGQKLIDEGIDEDGIMDDEEFMQYKRLIAEHCIYGVDLKPTAVELAKLSIWLTTFAKDRPLTFLDHRLRAGNSLVGAWLDRTEEFSAPRTIKGKKLNSLYFVSKEALTPSKLHDKAYIAQLKELQKENQESYIPAIINLQSSNLLEQDIDLGFIESLVRHRIVDLSSDELNAEDVHIKARIFEAEREIGSEFDRLKTYMDLTCAVWFWDTDTLLPPSSIELYDIRKHLFGEEVYFATSVERITHVLAESRRISQEQRFFHWELEFPELYFDEEAKRLSNSGFDAIIGNPPWDVVQPNSQEFFSNYDPYFRDYDKQKALKIIDQLTENSDIASVWQKYQLSFENFSNYLKSYFDPTGILKGKIDTYRLFTLHNFRLTRKDGNLGIIIPSDFYTGEGNTELRKLFLEQSRINFLFSFENKKKLFPIHASFKFILFSAKKGSMTYNFPAQFMMHDYNDLYEHDKFVHIDKNLIIKFSPETLSINEFQTQEDIDIASKIYSDHPLLGETVADHWNLTFAAEEFNVTRGLPLFNQNKDGYQIYEGKMIWHYDNRYGEPSENYISVENAGAFFSSRGKSYQYYRLANRLVASSTNERTLISTIIPRYSPCVNSLSVQSNADQVKNIEKLFILSILSSFSMDYIIRNKVTTNVNVFYLYTLPIPRLQEHNDYFDALVRRALCLVNTGEAYKELWDEIAPNIDWSNLNTSNAPLGYPSKVEFAYYGNMWDKSTMIQGKTDTANRFDIGDREQLRAEIDAIVAHLYGLNRDEMSFILDTFTALSNAETREFGEFRSKRMVLEEMKRLEGCING
jgi:hypothetical protein